jgi:tetratricopeptide (TPR) repeat protein
MDKYRQGHYKGLPIDFSGIKDVMEESLLNYTLALSINSKDLALGLKTISNYEKKISDYEKIINPEMLIALYYKMARICISSDKPKNALRWVNRILNTTYPNVRPDIQSYTRILNLIVHLDLGNIDLLESAITSAERFLKKNKMLYKMEYLFFDLMRNTLKLSHEKDKLKLFHTLKEKVMDLKNDPLENNAFSHFDYLEWIEKKLRS